MQMIRAEVAGLLLTMQQRKATRMAFNKYPMASELKTESLRRLPQDQEPEAKTYQQAAVETLNHGLFTVALDESPVWG
jgi:hypothetical protein